MPLHFKVDGHVAWIILDRPEALNAIDPETHEELVVAWKRVRDEENLRVAVLTGAGSKAFCSGVDLKRMGEFYQGTPAGKRVEVWNREPGIGGITRNLEVDKPVIAAINGAATGAGMDFALQCDLRYAAESARLGETYVRVGLVPGAGGTWFLPRLVGSAKALELFWTGDLISAQEAERLGIVNKVLPDAELMTYVQGVASRIADGPPLSIRFIKRAVYQGARLDLRASLDLISSHFAVVSSSADHKEAVAAWQEKRKPKFSGR
jgi:enoyl-CoA hydratase/carnithine racemase